MEDDAQLRHYLLLMNRAANLVLNHSQQQVLTLIQVQSPDVVHHEFHMFQQALLNKSNFC